MFDSTGIISYGPMYTDEGFRIVMDIDQNLADYYFNLIPKEFGCQKPYYKPHVTVVRTKKEQPTLLQKWYSREGQKVKFAYDGKIKQDENYFWLEIYSSILQDIRVECGLPRFRNGFTCFHLTLANLKHKKVELPIEPKETHSQADTQEDKDAKNQAVMEAMQKELQKDMQKFISPSNMLERVGDNIGLVKREYSSNRSLIVRDEYHSSERFN